MSTRVGGRQRHGEEVDEFEREELLRELKHDYSSSSEGIVPPEERRPRRHHIFLWITFYAGLAYIFLGFTFYEGGFSLPKIVVVNSIAIVTYLAYSIPSGYLGAKTGQTYSLLTRSVFGLVGSAIISVFVLVTPLGWTGFQANLLAQVYDGLYGWGFVVGIGVIIAVVGIVNNVLGFTGISLFARYVAAPLIILWVLYLVIKGLVQTSGHVLTASPKTDSPISFLFALTLALGFVVWGNEADVFRYAKPQKSYIVPPLAIALNLGLLVFTTGGWILAARSGLGSGDFGPAIEYMTTYALFGFAWLTFIVTTAAQIAINDANYYQSLNGGQNLIGGWRRWRRWYFCMILAAAGGFAAWLIPHTENGFFKVAAFLAVTVPCGTVIMCVDRFVLPRLFKLERRYDRVPSYREISLGNWPAIAAMLIAVAFGAYGTGLFSFLGEDPTTLWGYAPAEAWVMAGGLYLGFVAVVRRMPNARGVLGFASFEKERITDQEAVPTA